MKWKLIFLNIFSLKQINVQNALKHLKQQRNICFSFIGTVPLETCSYVDLKKLVPDTSKDFLLYFRTALFVVVYIYLYCYYLKLVLNVTTVLFSLNWRFDRKVD